MAISRANGVAAMKALKEHLKSPAWLHGMNIDSRCVLTVEVLEDVAEGIIPTSWQGLPVEVVKVEPQEMGA